MGKKFKNICAQIRLDGFCKVSPESSKTTDFAYPVFNLKGEFMGALGCHAPTFRCPPEKHSQIIITLQAYAEQLGKKLDAPENNLD